MPVAASSGGQADLAARAVTGPFHDLSAAQAAGYSVEVADLAGLTCIADPTGMGSIGIHYLDPTLLHGSVSATTPEVLVSAPGPNGQMRLDALEYLVPKANWDAARGGLDAAPPSLSGQEFMLTLAGNRYGLPDFYSLRAWIWDPNPNGMFAMWNPRVTYP